MFTTIKPEKDSRCIAVSHSIALLEGAIERKENIVLVGPRNIGKTTILRFVTESDKYSIYINLNKIATLKNLNIELINSAYSLHGINNFYSTAKNSIINTLKILENFKLKQIGEKTLQMTEEGKIDKEEMLCHALEIISFLASKQRRKIKLIINELGDFNSLLSENKVTEFYPLAKSYKNIILIFTAHSLSEAKKLDFENTLVHNGLNKDDALEYIEEVLVEKNLEYDYYQIEKATDFLKYTPLYTLQFLDNILDLLAATNKTIVTKEVITESIQKVYRGNLSFACALISLAKQNKHNMQALLYAASKDKENELSAINFYNANTRLERLGILRRLSKGKYEITDAVLEMYLKEGE